MRFLTRALVVIVLLALVGAGIFLATWEMPPPSREVEQTIPNDRFQQ